MENMETKKSGWEKAREIVVSKPAKAFYWIVSGVAALMGTDKMFNDSKATNYIADEMFVKGGRTQTQLTPEQIEKTQMENQDQWREFNQNQYGGNQQKPENISSTDKQ